MDSTQPNDGRRTVSLSPRQLAHLRFSALDTLREDLEVTAAHAYDGWGGISAVALGDAQHWARHVRESIDALDAVGWPTEDDLKHR